jgi:hypothetical protein
MLINQTAPFVRQGLTMVSTTNSRAKVCVQSTEVEWLAAQVWVFGIYAVHML